MIDQIEHEGDNYKAFAKFKKCTSSSKSTWFTFRIDYLRTNFISENA